MHVKKHLRASLKVNTSVQKWSKIQFKVTILFEKVLAADYINGTKQQLQKASHIENNCSTTSKITVIQQRETTFELPVVSPQWT